MRLEKGVKGFSKNSLLFILLIIVIGISISIKIFFVLFDRKILINKQITIQEGDNISVLTKELDPIDRFFLKLYLRSENEELKDLKEGIYSFSGSYSKNEIIKIFKKGPSKEYIHITLLEGWSKFDYDKYLSEKGYINSGSYIEYVDNQNNINKFISQNDFLEKAFNSNSGELLTLEGFLYPDTYYLDLSNDLLSQLVALQLKAFKEKVWGKYELEIENFKSKRLDQYYEKINFSLYDFIKMASIIENEERIPENKEIVAGILLNKLYSEGGVFADVTLCYGLKLSYEDCSPSIILSNIKDKSNPYNSRQALGLPPTPISSPSLATIKSLLNFQKTDYYYYLHDKNGKLHPSSNYGEHNLKKSKYLSN